MDPVAKRIHENAQNIADLLLEQTVGLRRCPACDKEFGVRSPHEHATHGTCKRHAIDFYRHSGSRKAEQRIRELEGRPDTDFAPDLRTVPPDQRGEPVKNTPLGLPQ